MSNFKPKRAHLKRAAHIHHALLPVIVREFSVTSTFRPVRNEMNAMRELESSLPVDMVHEDGDRNFRSNSNSPVPRMPRRTRIRQFSNGSSSLHNSSTSSTGSFWLPNESLSELQDSISRQSEATRQRAVPRVVNTTSRNELIEEGEEVIPRRKKRLSRFLLGLR